MSKPVPAIRSVKARGLVVPLARPLKNAFGVFDVAPLVQHEGGKDQRNQAHDDHDGAGIDGLRMGRDDHLEAGCWAPLVERWYD